MGLNPGDANKPNKDTLDEANSQTELVRRDRNRRSTPHVGLVTVWGVSVGSQIDRDGGR